MAQKAERFLLSRLAWLGALTLIALSAFCLVVRDLPTALAALVASGIVLTSPALPLAQPTRAWQLINHMLVLTLALVLVSGLWFDSSTLLYWLFALPLITLGLLPARIGFPLTVIAIAVILAGLGALTGDPARHQVIAPLILTTALAGVFFLLWHYKSRQIAPLRHSDELTQAASRDYLTADLYKEIQRSEREGLDLSVVMLGLDTHLSEPETDTDLQALLPRVGRYLHSRLRDFDTWYRVADLQFLVILPGVPTAGASKRAEQIRLGLMSLFESHGLEVAVSAGVAGLNIGDDADTLQQAVASALQGAQKKGGNRVQAWSTWSHTPPPDTEGSPVT
ncbi:diguanylate cyclase [Marinobacter bryozoorum]|jgi:diguanylate cyclase (GGDEF)-like protein|uniref:GGDEF domain-containing protein n=1 Tax=Marinobacter bryozoorum TaxID=256324 RepID=UPI0020048C93|nr:diguanylate cyclase [Marinobacter bryozoorum]MCK7543902.1 diguanylate cyclase [Marinobacter bryozoorum]